MVALDDIQHYCVFHLFCPLTSCDSGLLGQVSLLLASAEFATIQAWFILHLLLCANPVSNQEMCFQLICTVQLLSHCSQLSWMHVH